MIRWHSVKGYLRSRHERIYEQLTTTIDTIAAQSFAFDYWAGGGDLKNLADLKNELETYLQPDGGQGKLDKADKVNVANVLHETARHAEETSILAGSENVWSLPLAARKSLLNAWKAEIDQESLIRQLVSLHFDHHRADLRYKGIRQKIDKECLLKQNFIGLTTTACASNWWLLKSLDLEVVICEEAAEVMEAHTLCTLFPTIEHAIFIGDPLQLRPSVEQPSLSLETTIGLQYRLDESLFERFMYPHDPSLQVMPTSHLSVQRRMHPEIAAITSLTYPYLTSHSQTLKNPQPVGIHHRTYWLDHGYPETSPKEGTRSFSNQYEVDMVVALIHYLLRLNGYSLGEIAVLTPYNGQLAALKQNLQSSCPVWLNEKDRLALIEDGLLEEKDDDSVGEKEDVQMGDMLRIATIDNFQGEEARIVILSTVRSGNGLGFLKTHNRINVACSRARDGFYIIGNSRTLQTDVMWNGIISMFASAGRIGQSMQVGCTYHPNTVYHVSQPSDFELVDSCKMPCGHRLPCGHTCQELCHPKSLHEVFKCRKACNKELDCGHTCRKMCFEECGRCIQPIGEQKLDCGHVVEVLCSGDLPECQIVLDKVRLPCGHIRTLRCYEAGGEHECEERCGATLSCGHPCTNICADCSGSSHPPCSAKCGKLLRCGHHCDSECHAQEGKEAACPPCQQPCRRACAHGHCQNPCSMICDPCVKIHKWTCIHNPGPSVICSLPPDALPCTEPCPKGKQPSQASSKHG